MQAPIFGFILSDNLDIKIPVGTIIEVGCRHGFWLDGPSTMVCDRTGAWLGPTECKRKFKLYKIAHK